MSQEQGISEFSPDELAAAQQSIAASMKKDLEVAEPVVAPAVVVEPKVEVVPVDAVAPVVLPAAEPEPKVEPAAVPTLKTLEEYLTEKTAGKYSKWEDVEKEITAPRAEFADDNIKHWNELAKKGIKLDKEFFELQALDLEQTEMDPEDVILQAMRRKPEFKGLSDGTLRRELNKKYNYDQWIDRLGDTENPLTEDDLANQEIMLRDAHNDLEWLKNYKKERVFIPQENEEQRQQAADAQKQWMLNFEKSVEEIAAKMTTFSMQVKIDDKTTETFEYKYSDADRKEDIELMKLLPLGTNILVNRFAEKQSDGSMKVNDQRVLQMLLRDRTYEDAVSNALKDGIAIGARKLIKEDVKNAGFTPADHASGSHVPQTEAEALALAIKAKKQSFY